MISIAIFNNKGGVGKTTLLCNLAAYFQLAKGKRVLVVDADPQCNASSYILGNDKLFDIYTEQSNNTILKIVECISEGDAYLLKEDLPIYRDNQFGVDIIIGDTSFSAKEDFLSGDWLQGKNAEPRGLKTTMVFKDMLIKVAEDYDYVFFDVGPSLGAINRTILLACDYFIMPMSSDIFSLKAIENISMTLQGWKNTFYKGLLEYKTNKGRDYKIGDVKAECNLRFLGYINQQYTAKMVNDEKRPVKAYDRILQQIPEKIMSQFDHLIPRPICDTLLIGEIPTFSSLVPMSQMVNKPIFKLEGVDGVVGAHFKKVAEFKSVIEKVSDNVEYNLSRL